ncbi:Glutathione S-transferase, N-terminal domain protein [Shewanella sp. ANA-3]|uniref:glutathione S-transferase n=1 Tax=Shewanella sp. (strain ANA-3) TaxID=94122 RepID=UPI00005E192B|nr:glutathione S-transferase [Shewanella sp. ANA-3]ABK49092.1 Glutathione S-transferase, N-terminal domain protein [Shewanella sp. ANA-3]
MKLYELAPTPSARRVSIFLAEKGINIPRVNVDIRGGENLSPEFKAKSLNGRIPLLELDDGSYLCESVAICRYLEEIHPSATSLFGNSPLERARVEMWQRIIELQGLMVGFQAFRNLTGIYKDRENCVEAWGAESRQRIIDFLPTLDQQLAKSSYVASDNFTIADISAYVFISFIKNLDILVDDTLPHIQAWFSTVAQRPAIVSLTPKN